MVFKAPECTNFGTPELQKLVIWNVLRDQSLAETFLFYLSSFKLIMTAILYANYFSSWFCFAFHLESFGKNDPRASSVWLNVFATLRNTLPGSKTTFHALSLCYQCQNHTGLFHCNMILQSADSIYRYWVRLVAQGTTWDMLSHPNST